VRVLGQRVEQDVRQRELVQRGGDFGALRFRFGKVG
jgi:hypothetical protein